jgi:hypothetical protein
MSCSAFRDGWTIEGIEGEGGHAASCEECAQWVTAQRRAAAALANLAAGLEGPVVPDEREAALRAAFRQAIRPAPRRQSRRWPWAVPAAAVGCLLIGAGLLVRGRGGTAPSARVAAGPSPTSAPGSMATAVPASAVPNPVPGAAASAAPAPGAAVPKRPAAVRDETPPAASAAEPPIEVAATSPAEALLTGPVVDAGGGVPARLVESFGARGDAEDRGFHPLSPGLDPGPLESGQIVRVRLRPDVLESVGLPARGAAHEPVEAEVLVGPDGVARGIRLPPPKR